MPQQDLEYKTLNLGESWEREGEGRKEGEREREPSVFLPLTSLFPRLSPRTHIMTFALSKLRTGRAWYVKSHTPL